MIVSFLCLKVKMRIPVAVRSKTWNCGHSLAGAASSNPTGGLDICLLRVLCVCVCVLR